MNINIDIPESIKTVLLILIGVLISYPITWVWFAVADWRVRRRQRKEWEAECRRAYEAQQEYMHRINLEDYV